MKTPLLFVVLVLLPAGLCAQVIPNRDISFMGGVSWYNSQTIPGTSVTFGGSTGHSFQVTEGYQVLRGSAGSLWVEFYPTTTLSPGKSSASIGGKVDMSGIASAPGVRYMVPVQSRLSLYAVVGGGFAGFDYPVVTGGANPTVTINTAWHGVFEMGGGVDVRLSPRWSVRTECRDLVTGRGLLGVAGRHHIVPQMGLALHF